MFHIVQIYVGGGHIRSDRRADFVKVEGAHLNLLDLSIVLNPPSLMPYGAWGERVTRVIMETCIL